MADKVQSRQNTSSSRLQNRLSALVWVAVAGIVIVAGTVVAFKVIPPSGSSENNSMPTSTSVPGAGILSDDAERLVGKWVRTDTPYVIEIIDANDDGALQAAYYNPRSINVSRADARYTGGNLEVFIELRDINYPGSTYTLTYDRDKDILYGTYFQATMRQAYEVAFTRQGHSTP